MATGIKLDPNKVATILARLSRPCACGRFPRLADVGAEFGVSAATVHNIATRKSCGQVPFAGEPR